jgi:hypothetical protein
MWRNRCPVSPGGEILEGGRSFLGSRRESPAEVKFGRFCCRRFYGDGDRREALQKGMDICKIGGKILINIPAPNWTKWASDHRYYLKDYREQDPDHQISLEDVMEEARSRDMEILCYYLYKCDVPQQYQFIALGSKIEWEILNEGIKSNAVQQQLAGVL